MSPASPHTLKPWRDEYRAIGLMTNLIVTCDQDWGWLVSIAVMARYPPGCDGESSSMQPSASRGQRQLFRRRLRSHNRPMATITTHQTNTVASTPAAFGAGAPMDLSHDLTAKPA